MRNTYRIDGDDVLIAVKATTGAWLAAVIDIVDLPLAQSHIGTWYASPAKAPAGKFYVFGKQWSRIQHKSTTISLHRLLMGFPPCDVNHIDNDGLNNRRLNMNALSHQDNQRWQWPEKDWFAYDRAKTIAEEYRKERQIAADVAQQFGLGRQGMWRIRRGQVTRSPAVFVYHDACELSKIRPFELIRQAELRDGKFGIMIDHRSKRKASGTVQPLRKHDLETTGS